MISLYDGIFLARTNASSIISSMAVENTLVALDVITNI
jgi:hypothetical protein